MSKPYKLRDGNGGSGDLRAHTGQFSKPGVSVPRLQEIYKANGPLPDDNKVGAEGDKVNGYGAAPAVKKSFRTG